MNFMRDTFHTDKKKRKISSKDINFFQTVREGTRRYGSKQEEVVHRETSKTSSSCSSVVGRTFLRPVRTKASTNDSNLRSNELSVLNILEDEFNNEPPTPLLSSIHNADGKSFFSSDVNFPIAKRPKTLHRTSFWQFNEGEEISDVTFLPSTSFAPNEDAPQNINEKGSTHLYIVETAENQCSNFRVCPLTKFKFTMDNLGTPVYNTRSKALGAMVLDKEGVPPSEAETILGPMGHSTQIGLGDESLTESEESVDISANTHLNSIIQGIDEMVQNPSNEANIQRQRANSENKNALDDPSSPPRSPEFVPPSTGLEGYGLSPPQAPLLEPVSESSVGEDIPTPQDISRPSTFKTPSGQVSSTSYHQFSPLRPPASSSYNTRNTFFSDVTPGTSRLSEDQPKGDTFFKTPGDPYDTMFSTPGRVTALPRITTPQLFLPCHKSTPSKTTPQTKSSGKTPQSVSRDSFFVISITEGRGHALCEIGMAAIDLNHPDLFLSQFSDSQTYKKTLAKINIIDPAEMLVPDTLKGVTPSVLYKTVTETFPEMRVMTVKRKHYSAKHGLETIRSLLLPESSSVEMIIHRKYYTLAATEALMKYIEIKHGKLFAPKSLKVNYQSAKDIVSIDMETCQRLELVMSNAEMVFPEKYSLFGLLNHTKTLGGKRRLRVSLLQPSSSLDVLRERQNTVTALVSDPRSLEALQTTLLKFSNVERLLWLCLKSPNFKNEAKTFETLTNYILLLKASLEAVPHLRKVLQDIDNDYIINIRDDLSDSRFDAILVRILTMIQEDARPARGFAEAERQRCFAIKDGVNDLLDVARATYSDLIQQVMGSLSSEDEAFGLESCLAVLINCAENYNISGLAREHGLPLRMVHTTDLGFHPSYLLPKNLPFHKEDLHEIFTEVKLKNRTVHLLTEEIYVYNMRIKRALQEIQLITNVYIPDPSRGLSGFTSLDINIFPAQLLRVIYDLVESLREEISFLYRLCDHISDLDFLSCLAQVSSNTDFTKPIFADHTSIVGARHPILDHTRPAKPIPNNIIASKKKNFNIITGPNMGGKTVYVLMIPLIQIMAQIGCYVPADKAEIRITDHIYVKKGTSDSIECKLSSFSKEVNELTYTISNMTDTSLIILDEVCTGTLSDEGTALAWGFCEQFLKKSVFTFLTTHYHYLTNLSKIFKNVTNYNMEAIERNPDDSEYCGLTFTYRLLPGVTKSTNYALRLMMESALPESIKKNAIEIVEKLVKKRAASLPLVVPETPNTSLLHSKIDKIEYFMTNLYGLSMTDNFTEEMISTLQRMALEEILSDDEDDMVSRRSYSKEVESSGLNSKDRDKPEDKTTPAVPENQEKSREEKNDDSNELSLMEDNKDEEHMSTPLNLNFNSTSSKSSVSISAAEPSTSKMVYLDCNLLGREESVVTTPLRNRKNSLDTTTAYQSDDNPRTNLVKTPISNMKASTSSVTKSKSTPEMYRSPVIQSRKHTKSDDVEKGFRSPLPPSPRLASSWKGAANSVFKTVSLPNIQNLSSPRNLIKPATFNTNVSKRPQGIETHSPRSEQSVSYVSSNFNSPTGSMSTSNSFVKPKATVHRAAHPHEGRSTASPGSLQRIRSASVPTHMRNQHCTTRHSVNIFNSPKAVSQPDLPLLHNRNAPVSKTLLPEPIISSRPLNIHSPISKIRNPNIGSDYSTNPSHPGSSAFQVPSVSEPNSSPVSLRTQHSGGGSMIPRSTPSSGYSANSRSSKSLVTQPVKSLFYQNPVPSTSYSDYPGKKYFSSSNDSSDSK